MNNNDNNNEQNLVSVAPNTENIVNTPTPIQTPNDITQQQSGANPMQNATIGQPVASIPTIENPIQNSIIAQSKEIQNIPTVEQSAQEFVNNTQSTIEEKKEQKKEGINYALVITLFIVVIAAIIFLFPLLLKYI